MTQADQASTIRPDRRESKAPASCGAVLRRPSTTTVSKMLIKSIAIERLAMALHHLDGGRPLLGRLTHLRQFEFPGPRPRGAGVKTPFGFDDAVKLLAVFELLSAGIGTGQAAEFLKREWPVARLLVAHGWSRHLRTQRGSVAPPKRYLALSAATLSQFEKVPEDEEREMIENLGPLTAGEIASSLEGGIPSRRIAILDLEAFILKVADELEASGAGNRAEFDEEMSILCRQAFGSDDERKWMIGTDEPANIVVERR